MPHYDYQCLNCNLVFEEFHAISDEPVQSCPECNGNVKRLIGSGAGVIFKGTGFYKTDYANKPSCDSTSSKSSSCSNCPASQAN